MAKDGDDEKASGSTPSVFVSYASQDVAVANAVVEALERHGVKCWIAPRDVVPGALYADEIVRAINEAAVVVLVLSEQAVTSSHVGKEIERASSKRRRIIALHTDSAQLTRAFEYFLSESQWIEVGPGGIEAASEKLVAAVRRHSAVATERGPETVVADDLKPVAHPDPHAPDTKSAASRRARVVITVTFTAMVAVALGYVVVGKFWISNHVKSQPTASAAQDATSRTGVATLAAAAAAAFSPPPHSIAVLPFVNMSGDPKQEYFSDGLTEELLNSLSRINTLQVAARTSAFSFKGKDADITTIAHKLNVGAVLEGSVRRSGHTIRVTTQLINAVTGFHLWSETYDRDLGDVLKLQTEIATAVAGALKVTLLGDEVAKIEVGGTHNPAAFDAYLRATKTLFGGYSPKVIETAVAGYTEAIRLDPDYALAYSARSLAFGSNAALWDTTTSAVRADLDKAQADAAKAIALAPGLSEGYLARAVVYEYLLEFKEASEEYERALVLGPGNARVLRDYGGFAVYMGRNDSGLTAVRRAVVLDPLNSSAQGFLGQALFVLRRYPEAVAAYNDAEALPSTTPGAFLGAIGLAYYLRGDFESARSVCEQKRQDLNSQSCLAMTYDKLGRHADAEAMLAKMRATGGETSAVTYAAVYAQWGNTAKALERLEAALRLRDPDLVRLKTEPLLDPLRKEPRFQAIERQLKFPD